jgi:hypothetical protein
MMFAIGQPGDLKKGSSVPTVAQINKRLAVIHEMEPQRINYLFAT